MVKRLWIACRRALLLITLLPCAARAQGYLSQTDSGVRDAKTNVGIAFLPQAPSASRGQQEAQSKTQQEKKVEEKEQSQRTLGVVPRFGTTDRMDAPPLSSGAKFHLFAKTAFDPVTVVIAAAQAGVSQADNQFKGYGQGAGGYGKRFGAAFADQVSSGILQQLHVSDIVQAGSSLLSERTWGFSAPVLLQLDAGSDLPYRQRGPGVQRVECFGRIFVRRAVQCLLPIRRSRVQADHEPGRARGGVCFGGKSVQRVLARHQPQAS